ncbi:MULTISPECIES: OsmC family protein [unclassified Imperialibacter]|uniref:OsmC family protein n=1 Tax=unclassified Imperialibacter TaxID=2629706 RepID=UPI001252251E|nr:MULTISPECIES: OsmC family protein [unclassified Imperialibacter]CAD5295469.1 OsmC family peroxiredoxin [Imperialibacter sp. 75]CAD5296210.1 OsmC family peroxiredoxin [Imperialibacter sp. 89]VVT14982.1 Peroxiredoxin [Imperialibacter sp. EC-SDR9]
MAKTHHYQSTIRWTGNKGTGTSGYRDYERSHTVSIDGKPDILTSSDPSFRGDKRRHNPEELFLSSISSCHMLWFLHLCSDAGIVVTDYADNAEGTMVENPDGSGQFSEVVLRPAVTITDATRVDETQRLHHKANEMCFIARSVNFKVRHEPSVRML